jgi:hypothetical protein
MPFGNFANSPISVKTKTDPKPKYCCFCEATKPVKYYQTPNAYVCRECAIEKGYIKPPKPKNPVGSTQSSTFSVVGSAEFTDLELKYLEDCVITKISAYQINITRAEAKGNFDSKNARELPKLQKLRTKLQGMQP